jgi:hypothetical protein
MKTQQLTRYARGFPNPGRFVASNYFHLGDLNLSSDAVMKWCNPHTSIKSLFIKFHKHTNNARTALH